MSLLDDIVNSDATPEPVIIVQVSGGDTVFGAVIVEQPTENPILVELLQQAPTISGFSGYSGMPGTFAGSGFSGYSGFSAASPGPSGFSGYSSSGISGYSGIGRSGYSGFSGTAGSGYSGFSALRSTPIYTINVKDAPYNAAGDGLTDDTTSIQDALDYLVALGGGSLFFPMGVYLVSGALQDTSFSNCQLRLAPVSQADPQVNITIFGETRPPFQTDPSVTAAMVTDGYSTIKSTLTGATGTAALFGGFGPSNNAQNNVALHVHNLIFAMPSNPTLSCLNCTNLQGNEIKNVLIHCGNIDLNTITQPTNSNAYGVILPPINHSDYNRVEGLTVFGYYTGMALGELTDATGIRFEGCWIALEAPPTFHPSYIGTLGVYACPYGIKFPIIGLTLYHYINIEMFDSQYPGGTGQAWQEPVYMIDDPSNYGRGKIEWVSVVANVGDSDMFPINGGQNLYTTRMGKRFTWWLAGGAHDCVAAYQAQGARSIVQSKVNLNSPGVHNIDAGVDPSWDSVDGWTFNGSTQFLGHGGGIIPDRNYTIVVKFSNVSNGGYLFGVHKDAGTVLYGIAPNLSSAVQYWNGAAPGGNLGIAPAMTKGILAIVGNTPVRNGEIDGVSTMSADADAGLNLNIGAVNHDGVTDEFLAGSIQAMAIYSYQLSLTEIQAVVGAMAATILGGA